MASENMRSEQEVFSDLETLCCSPGYAHALAMLCFRDTFMKIGDTLEAQHLANMSSPERLCRTETSVLLGLMVKGNSFLDSVESKALAEMINRSEVLLAELHETMHEAFKPIFMEALKNPTNANPFQSDVNPFKSGIAQRESIFYSAESAFDFQFQDFALYKYHEDNDWFIANKGYSIIEAVLVLKAIAIFQSDHLMVSLESLRQTPMEQWTVLPGFIFSNDDIVKQSHLPKKIVTSFLNSMTCPKEVDNSAFNTIDDFNYINAYPLIKVTENSFLYLQGSSLAQAFYETPFFWMNDDGAYKDKAAINRGQFTEKFSKTRLESVFEAERVFENVEIRKKNKKDVVGEIDVLVLFGDRAVVLQAKSKKLTLQARKGNETALNKDFQQSVQGSYDQGLECTKFLLADDYELFDKSGKLLKKKYKIKEAYIVCVVSDHYPGLNFQARNFLKYEDTVEISPPLVTDIFFLDVMCEMLQSPLLFISYLNRRLRYFEQVMSSNEFAVLGYHLRRNLWLQNDEAILLHDDISIDLDIAMFSRRTDLQGEVIPPGLLTKVVNPNLPLGQLLKEIEGSENPSIIEFGLLVFTFSEATIKQLNGGIKRICTLTKNDGQQHDFSIAIVDTGITIHSNNAPMSKAMESLGGHAEIRKYDCKTKSWFGVLLSSAPECKLRNGMKLQYDYEYSKQMESKLAGMPRVANLKGGKIHDFSGLPRKKLGRNDPCPCGSGLKYKKCCL